MITPFGMIRRPNLKIRQQQCRGYCCRLCSSEGCVDVSSYSANCQVIVFHCSCGRYVLQLCNLQGAQGKHRVKQRGVVQGYDGEGVLVIINNRYQCCHGGYMTYNSKDY